MTRHHPALPVAARAGHQTLGPTRLKVMALAVMLAMPWQSSLAATTDTRTTQQGSGTPTEPPTATTPSAQPIPPSPQSAPASSPRSSASAGQPSDATRDAITAITLSSGGMAEIRRRTQVGPDNTAQVTVPLAQINDILKSLRVRDSAGPLQAVTLDGLSPVDETFERLPYSPEAMGSLATLTGALQGVPVRAASGGRSVEGIVLGVSEQTVGGERPTTEHWLSVLTRDGQGQTLRLGADTTLDILDPAVQDDLRRAAAVTGRGHTDSQRTIALRLAQGDVREVELTYVVAAPVWKTAYRLETGASSRLQAWAVLENATGDDWNDVAVTLTSGAPVILSQALLERYWPERADVPVRVGAAAPPRVDVAADMAEVISEDAVAQPAPPAFERSARGSAGMRAAPAPAPQSDSIQSPGTQAVEGETSATYALPAPVSLPAGQTLSVPYLDAALPAERVSIFQPERRSIHPVAAVMLKNTTPASLPPGILTVFDDRDGHIGDAELAGIPPGEQRLASFADDRKVTVESTRAPNDRLTEISVANGVLRATRIVRQVTTYRIRGASDAPRTLIIEQAKQAGWRLTSSALDSETPDHYRMRVALTPGQRIDVQATAERTERQDLALIDTTAETLFRWSGAAADERTASRLKTLAEQRQRLAQAETAVARIDETIERTTADQARVRDNLAAVPADSSLGQRYTGMLAEQEDQLAKLETERGTAEAERKRRQDELGTGVTR